ncbi:MAG TPA: hypothetical protein VGM65_05340 [Candidatus Udaeobacter sp.]|jgi:hypothetical protein
MAYLSSAAVATLVSEIADLRKALEGTLIDQAEVVKRYDAATNGLLTSNGSLDTAKWENLTPKQQGEIEARLSKLKQELLDLNEVYVNEDGPADEGSFMHKDYASNKAIIWLTVLAFLGLSLDLALICHEWETATAGTRGILDFTTPSVSTAGAKAQETGAGSLPPPSPKERAALKRNATPASALSALSTSSSPTSEVADAMVSPATATVPARSAAAASPLVSPSPEKTEEKATTPGRPTEQAVLWMVILMGALGGFLRLASSMANYVGERLLLRSWIIYYILTPLQGAALAPLIYFLLRVGVLNPANASANGRPSESLNLIGIYAFAALTGLFSKQAIEMMADVFSTIFKKVSAKDSLEKSKPEAVSRK